MLFRKLCSLLVLLALISLLSSPLVAAMNPGGKASLTTIDSTTDPKIVQLVQDLKPQIEAKTSATYSTFVPVAYRSQVVAGTNYYVKIQVADNPPSYIHAVIYKHFSNPAVVTSAATDKSFSDDL